MKTYPVQKLVFLTSHNQYESKRHFTHCLSDALRKKGVQTFVIEPKEGALSKEEMARIQGIHPDLIASFHAILPLPDGKLLSDHLHIPFLNLIVDPALYMLHLLKSKYSFLSVVDRYDLALICSTGFKNALFLPHGVEKLDIDPTQSRKYDVVFIGSSFNHEALKSFWRSTFSRQVSELIELAIFKWQAGEKETLFKTLWDGMHKQSLEADRFQFPQIYRSADYYIRSYERWKMLDSLCDVQVDIFGAPGWMDEVPPKEWKSYFPKRDNIRVHPPVTYAASLEILSQAKICLNSSPFFMNGSHERMFAGPMCGSVLFTNDNPYAQEAFSVGKEIETFTYRTLGTLNDRIKVLLQDDERRIEMANLGRKRVLEEHTWDKRAEILIEKLPEFYARIYTQDFSPN